LLFQESDFTKNKIEFGSEEMEDLALYNNTYKFDQSSRSKSDSEPMIYFENVPNLKKLNLSISFLNSIDIVSFRKLANLECLDFYLESSKSSQEEMKGLFNNFKILKTIKICGISGIDESSFSNLVNLETLEFSYCDFIPNNMKGSISCNTFSNLNKLTHLDLSSSFRLKDLDACLFKYIHNLESFAVSGLERIHAGAFINLNKLKKLRLESFDLVEIPSYTFQGLNSLEELNLSFYKLECIETGSFDYVKSLKRLDISNLRFIFYKNIIKH
jgi:Leucine-rich repeat (LRR) protein